MKLLRLDLTAYGVFTDKSIEFDPTKSFHLIYGLNEAGKSTALNAVRDLLFGMSVRTTYNFLHENARLRIGGVLESNTGEQLELARLKRNKNALVDTSGAPISEDLLLRILGNTDADTFDRQFGISYDQLKAGGEEITRGEGDAGQAIFSTGLGNVNIRHLLEEFGYKAGVFFKSRGSSQISELIRRHNVQLVTVKEASLPSTEFKRLQGALDARLIELDSNRGLMVQREKERNRYVRLSRALPKLNRRTVSLARLKELGALPDVPPNEPEDLNRLEQHLAETKRDFTKTELEIADYTHRLESLNLSPDLLKYGEEIGVVVEKVGGIKKAAEDIPKIDLERENSYVRAQRIHDSLCLPCSYDDVESMRTTKSQRATILGIATRSAELSAKLEGLTSSSRNLEGELDSVEQELKDEPALKNRDLLEALVTEISTHGDIEQQLKMFEAELSEMESAEHQSLGHIGLWSGTVEELEALVIPSDEVINEFADRADDLHRDSELLKSEITEAERALLRADEALKRFESIKSVPSIQQLEEARSNRDMIWLDVRKVWLDKIVIDLIQVKYESEAAMAEIFEAGLSESDEVSDKIRDHATDFSQHEQLIADRVLAKDSIERLSMKKHDLDDRSGQNTKEWYALWSCLSIAPESPKSMQNWVLMQKQLLDRHSEICRRRLELERLQIQIERDRAELLNVLSVSIGIQQEELTSRSNKGLLEQVRVCLRQEDDKKRHFDALKVKRSEMIKRISHEKKAISDLMALQGTNLDTWNKAISRFTLEASIIPEGATEFLDDLNEMFTLYDKSRDLQSRILAMKSDAERFGAEVKSICMAVAPDLLDTGTFDTVKLLNQRFREAGEADSVAKTLKSGLSKSELELHKLQSDIDGSNAQLREMLGKYHFESAAQIREMHIKSTEATSLKRTLIDLDADLVYDAGSDEFDYFLRSANELDPDLLPGTLSTITEVINGLSKDSEELNRAIGGLRTELAAMDGSSLAAAAAEDASAILAEIPSQVDRYVRLSLAEFLLREEIELYRVMHQDPILARAGELFSLLTLGSFTSLLADEDDKRNPILSGIRADGKEVRISGMSDGTVDQLYLAFRLAGLENYLRSNEPQPFIVDDILIKFDDERAKACFRVLAELSQKTQILFFTHQNRHREIAQEELGERIDLHDL